MRGLLYILILFVLNSFELGAQSKLSFSSNEFNIARAEPETREAKKRSTEFLDKMSFELVGGLIFLDAELGGSCDQYIFDTGAPTLILNSKKLDVSRNVSYIAGFSGEVPVVSKTVKRFQLGANYQKRIVAYYTDISHLELVKQRPVKGLIGVDAFKKKEVLFNYEDKEMIFLPKKRRSKTIGNYEEVHMIPLRKQGHIPVIKMKIGKKIFYFGIDTGAEVNIISKRLLRRIKSENIKLSDSKKTIRGIDKTSKSAICGVIKKLSVKGKDFHNMDFVFADISNINHSNELRLDGILGFPFLSSEIFSIDFRKNKLYIWAKNESEPVHQPVELFVADEEE